MTGHVTGSKVVAAIGMGGNLGNRASYIQTAMAKLRILPESQNFLFSSIYETEPIDCHEALPFLNAAARFETNLAPHALLNHLMRIESELGRQRSHANAPRTIDLDLLLYGEASMETPNLIVPHPRLASRIFALIPLVEIWPQAVHPIHGQTVDELLAEHPLEAKSAVIATRQVSSAVAL